MQKLLGFYRRQLSTCSRCQTLLRSKCTDKWNCCKSRGTRAPVPHSWRRQCAWMSLWCWLLRFLIRRRYHYVVQFLHLYFQFYYKISVHCHSTILENLELRGGGKFGVQIGKHLEWFCCIFTAHVEMTGVLINQDTFSSDLIHFGITHTQKWRHSTFGKYDCCYHRSFQWRRFHIKGLKLGQFGNISGNYWSHFYCACT